MSDVRDQLGAFADRVAHRLAAVSERWREAAPQGDHSPRPEALLESVVELSLRGGKRLRPALAYYASKCVDSDVPDAVVLDACLSVEMLQTGLLIHDDIMDRDDFRRGGPTVHRLMFELTGDEHTGNSLAILAGSLALTFARDLLHRSGLSGASLINTLFELEQMEHLVIYGQALDLVGGAPPETIHLLKTTSYTTVGPLLLGAAITGASSEVRKVFRNYGTPLGRAFQIRDDLLGLFGDQRLTGKPVGADLREGKRTDVVKRALEDCTDANRNRLKQVLGNRNASDEALTEAVEIIASSGARDAVEAMIETLTEQALSAVDRGDLLLDEGREFLVGLARLLSVRDR